MDNIIVDLKQICHSKLKNKMPFTKAEKYFFTGKDFRQIIDLLKNKRL